MGLDSRVLCFPDWATQAPLQTVIFKKLFHLHEVQELVKLISIDRIQSVITWDEGESWLQKSRREFAGVDGNVLYLDSVVYTLVKTHCTIHIKYFRILLYVSCTLMELIFFFLTKHTGKRRQLSPGNLEAVQEKKV